MVGQLSDSVSAIGKYFFNFSKSFLTKLIKCQGKVFLFLESPYLSVRGIDIYAVDCSVVILDELVKNEVVVFIVSEVMIAEDVLDIILYSRIRRVFLSVIVLFYFL